MGAAVAAGDGVWDSEDVGDCVAGYGIAEGKGPGGETTGQELGGDGTDGGAAE